MGGGGGMNPFDMGKSKAELQVALALLCCPCVHWSPVADAFAGSFNIERHLLTLCRTFWALALRSCVLARSFFLHSFIVSLVLVVLS